VSGGAPSGPSSTLGTVSHWWSAEQLGAGAALLVVSPHLDDAALSCEALIGRAEPLDVVTVLAGRPDEPGRYSWDEFCGFTDSDAAMDARIREDDAAFEGTPHRLHRLPLRDKQYLAGPRQRHDAVALTTWVDEWLAAQDRPPVVVVPVGAGLRLGRLGRIVRRFAGDRLMQHLRRWRQRGNPRLTGATVSEDHVWVRDTLVDHLVGGPATVLLYEEVPYLLARRGDGAAGEVATRTRAELEHRDVAIDTDAKLRRLGCYVSQRHQLIGGADFESGGMPAVERYWRLAPGSRSLS